MMSVLRVLSVTLALISVSACQNVSNPNSPTGFDPSKPVSSTNQPDGPGASVRASVQSWGIYLGNCPEGPSGCEKQIHPIGPDSEFWIDPPPWAHNAHYTFLAKWYHQWYTMHLCVDHPKVKGRRLRVDVVGPRGEFSGAKKSVVFDEGDIASPLCLAVPYQMSYGDSKITSAIGRFEVVEENHDLYKDGPTEWKVSIGVQIVDYQQAGH